MKTLKTPRKLRQGDYYRFAQISEMARYHVWELFKWVGAGRSADTHPSTKALAEIKFKFANKYRHLLN